MFCQFLTVLFLNFEKGMRLSFSLLNFDSSLIKQTLTFQQTSLLFVCHALSISCGVLSYRCAQRVADRHGGMLVGNSFLDNFVSWFDIVSVWSYFDPSCFFIGTSAPNDIGPVLCLALERLVWILNVYIRPRSVNQRSKHYFWTFVPLIFQTIQFLLSVMFLADYCFITFVYIIKKKAKGKIPFASLPDDDGGKSQTKAICQAEIDASSGAWKGADPIEVV